MIKKKEYEINVLEASKERIIQLFKSENTIRLSFSGGKDSIVLADIIYNLCVQEKIDKSKLIVTFIDEEAMFDDVIKLVEFWRKRFMLIGVKFDWYAMQYKHFNCLNSLTSEETFVCWDENKKDVWVRNKPKFAISEHELLIPRKDSYQDFLTKLDKKNAYVTLIGVRASESVQRIINIATMKECISYGNNTVMPLYDWKDKDIWLYILNNNLEIPKTYENLYRIGVPRNKLRISQFFSIDTAKSLVKMSELYPDLMERVIRREPNAYLCSLYWDTEMFGKSTKTRRKTEETDVKDYKTKVFELFKYPNPNFTKRQMQMVDNFKSFVANNGYKMNESFYKSIYDIIISGDPKKRSERAFYISVNTNYKKEN